MVTAKTIVISINACWNIYNFRQGLIAGLRAEGFRVVALAPDDAHSRRLEDLGVEHVPIAMDSKGISPARDLRLLWLYYRALRKLRPAAFLGFTIKPNIYGSLAAQWLGIPTINNVSGLGTAFIRRTWLTAVAVRLYRLAFRRSATVFFQNEEDRDLFLEQRIVEPGKARLLPGSGIDLAHFSPAEQVSAGGEVTFILIARLLRDKGVAEFVEAARLLRPRLPGARFQLLGTVDALNRTAIGRDELHAWIGEGNVEYLGDTDDVRPFIAAADCVVLPSYREGLPRVLLEGAAMGKPLIATNVPGCRQVIEPDGNGLLCEVRDAGSLADAMLAMAEAGQERRRAMGRRARQLVEQKYDERIVVQSYLAALRDALGPS